MSTVSTTRPTLNTLPNELILGILDYVALPSLLSLTRTNQHLHGLTLDYIYAVFFGPNATLFLRTIALPPPTGHSRLANQIRDVFWTLGPPVRSRHHLTSSERHGIAQTFRHLQIAASDGPLEEDLATLFVREVYSDPRSHHWFLELFLLFLPKVESLEVHDAWHWDDHDYWFTNVAANTTRFGCLKEVTIHGPLRIENIVPLLTLPTLRDLELWQVIVMRQASDQSFMWDHPERSVDHVLGQESSGLKRLALRESCIPIASLLPILSAIRSLQSFTYELEPNNLSYPHLRLHTIDYRILATALSKFASTLECIRLHAYEDLFISEIATLIAYTPALKNLDVGPLVLRWTPNLCRDTEAGIEAYVHEFAERMPTGLRTLSVKLRLNDEMAMEFLQWGLGGYFVKCCASAMAARGLRELGISCWAAGMEETIRREFESVGIRLLDE